MSALTLAQQLFELSYWHAMQNEPFKPRAYALASESVEALGAEVRETWKRGGIKALKKLPAVGPAIAEKIQEFFQDGAVHEWKAMRKRFPVEIWELSRIEGLGPKHLYTLYKTLCVKTHSDLARALATHRVQDLPGFGVKSEEKLTRGVALLKRASGRHVLGTIVPLADTIVARLLKVPGVQRCVYAGSLRRRQETVGDIDLIVTSSHPERVMDAFTSMPEVESIHEQGKTRASVRLSIGIDADLRVVPNTVFGATLQYFTGDKRHNILLREYAISKGLTLNEYGLFRGKKLLACTTEEQIYRALGMDTPPPEIRTGADELPAARHHALPDLLPYGSIRGDLQIQTDWTDGSASIEEMAHAAKREGLAYLAITDHTKSLAFIGGLDTKKIQRQWKEIDALNQSRTPRLARLLKGSEVDILRNGSLDLPDVTLSQLDWVGVSVHSSFTLPEAEMTRRIVKAISNPNVDCLFHPTGRLIGRREPYAVDMAEIIATAKKHRVALEIDAYPERSDLRDLHVRMAVEAGVPLVIDSDAHAPDHLRFLPFGEAIARRGWATKANIINTKTLPQFRTWLEKKRPRPRWTA